MVILGQVTLHGLETRNSICRNTIQDRSRLSLEVFEFIDLIHRLLVGMIPDKTASVMFRLMM